MAEHGVALVPTLEIVNVLLNDVTALPSPTPTPRPSPPDVPGRTRLAFWAPWVTSRVMAEPPAALA
jgi:hypothetical protein